MRKLLLITFILFLPLSVRAGTSTLLPDGQYEFSIVLGRGSTLTGYYESWKTGAKFIVEGDHWQIEEPDRTVAEGHLVRLSPIAVGICFKDYCFGNYVWPFGFVLIQPSGEWIWLYIYDAMKTTPTDPCLFPPRPSWCE